MKKALLCISLSSFLINNILPSENKECCRMTMQIAGLFSAAGGVTSLVLGALVTSCPAITAGAFGAATGSGCIIVACACDNKRATQKKSAITSDNTLPRYFRSDYKDDKNKIVLRPAQMEMQIVPQQPKS